MATISVTMDFFGNVTTYSAVIQMVLMYTGGVHLSPFSLGKKLGPSGAHGTTKDGEAGDGSQTAIEVHSCSCSSVKGAIANYLDGEDQH